MFRPGWVSTPVNTTLRLEVRGIFLAEEVGRKAPAKVSGHGFLFGLSLKAEMPCPKSIEDYCYVIR